MKTSTAFLLCLSSGFTLFGRIAEAGIIAHEGFDYADDTSIIQQDGGMGFTSVWKVTTKDTFARETVKNGWLVLGSGTENALLDSSKSSGASRFFPTYSDSIFYFKFTFKTSKGTLLNPDRLYMILSGDGNTNGWGNIELGTGLYNSIANDSNLPDSNITIRTDSVASGRHTLRLELVDETSYTVVAEISKSVPGKKEKYNTVRLWLNPSLNKIHSPLVAMPIAQNNTLHTINRVSFRIDETEATDQYFLDDIMVSTEWNDLFTPGGN